MKLTKFILLFSFIFSLASFSQIGFANVTFNNITIDSTSLFLYNETMTATTNITNTSTIAWVNLTIFNSTFTNVSSMEFSTGNGNNNNWTKQISYRLGTPPSAKYLYPGNYSFYITASDVSVSNSSIYNFTIKNNTQDVRIVFLVPSIIRMNVTNNNITISTYVAAKDFSTLKTYVYDSASHNTVNFDYFAENQTQMNSVPKFNVSNAPPTPLCENNLAGNLNGLQAYLCLFIPNSSFISPGFGYNLTFNTTDIFGNFYKVTRYFKATPQAISTNYYEISNNSQILINDSSNTNTSVVLKLNDITSATLSIALYNVTPGIPAYDPFNTSRFVEFLPSWERNAADFPSRPSFWAEIRMHYTDQQITNLGLDENNLKLQSYNETTSQWDVCSTGGVNTVSNYVYCNSTHFSTWGVTGTPTSSSGSTVSTGSGGGGGSTSSVTTVSNQEIETANIASSQPTLILMKNASQHGVEEVSIQAINPANNVQISVQSLGTSNPASQNPTGTVYRYLNISAGIDDSNVKSATIKFDVDNSWLIQNSIDLNSVVLNRYHNGAWQPLATRYLSSKGTTLTFQSQTPGFSAFAVTGLSSQQPSQNPTTSQTNTNLNQSAATSTSTQLAVDYSLLMWILPLIVVVAAAAFFLMRKKRKSVASRSS